MRAKLTPRLVIVLGLLIPALGFAAEAEKKEMDNALAPTAAELKKYDANGDGRLDDKETAKLRADRAAHLKWALAKYDANHNGKLDPDELAKMKEDEIIAARSERQQAKNSIHEQNVMRKAQNGGKARKN